MHQVYDQRFRRLLKLTFSMDFLVGNSFGGKIQEEGGISSQGRWIISMHQEETISLFQGRLTFRTRSSGPWTETMRTTVLQQFQLWQKLCLRMSRRFSRPLLEPHFSSLQLVYINKPYWSVCYFYSCSFKRSR